MPNTSGQKPMITYAMGPSGDLLLMVGFEDT